MWKVVIFVLCGFALAVQGREPADEARPLKQESDVRTLLGQTTTIYLDHRKSPSLLQLAISVPASAMRIRYDDIQIRVWDEHQKAISIRRAYAPAREFAVASTNLLWGGTADGDYYLDLAKGQHVAAIEVTREGETQRFKLFPSHHPFGYGPDK